MNHKIDFNYLVLINENRFFLKQKKKIKFIKKLSMYFRYKRVYVSIYNKFKDYFHIFLRFESLFGFLPKINSFKTRRKGKTKKIIFLRSTLGLKSNSFSENAAENILNYIFNLHNYLYLKFLISKKHKVIRLEELNNHFIAKNILINHNSISFENNLYFKWLDLNRAFINLKNIKFYKYKKKYNFSLSAKTLKFYECSFIINSNYHKFLLLPIKILIKNYKKLMLYMYKKFRRRRKKINEKTYILL